MGKASELGLEIRSFPIGTPAFLAGVIDALEIPKFINEAYAAQKVVGRYPDLSPGTVAKLFLINICHQHHPLYRIKEYFIDKDIPLLAGKEISLDALTDDRFGDLLDHMHSWGPRSLFTTIATNAFFKYGLSIRSLNYDTTSKIMWGTYKAEDGQVGTISITFGHSKDKREDKKQLKIGLGTADGVIVDAKVLSGNTDDKTFNYDALDDVDAILNKHNVDREDFYFVADAALFTQENIKKAHKHKLHFITRMPETVGVANKLIDRAWSSPESFETVELANSQGKAIYHVQEFTSEYKEYPVKCAVCHSPILEETKRNTIAKKVQTESDQIEKLAKTYVNRTFACEPDASKEISILITNKTLKKLRYHTISFTIVQEQSCRVVEGFNK
jgi:transposase